MTSCIHMENLQSNVNEVRRLYFIHRDVTGGTRGRKHDVEVLNKSGITLLVASWEAFVEDLARASFEHMLSSASDPSTFPNSVLVEASKDLRKDPDERKLWTLAKDGWRKVLIDHRDRILNRYIGRFHTPEPVQIDELFEKLIGINTLSKCWYWRKTTASGASERLAQLVRLRHQIAHRVRTDKAVHMKDLIRGGLLIQRLAVKSSNRLRTYLHSKTGVYPWGQFQYRNTS